MASLQGHQNLPSGVPKVTNGANGFRPVKDLIESAMNHGAR